MDEAFSPKITHNESEIKPCPSCKSSDFKLYRTINSHITKVPDGLDRGLFVKAKIETCCCCGIYRTTCDLNASEIEKIYSSESVCFEASKSKNEIIDEYIFSKNEFQILKTHPPATLLDVGCGAGKFLISARLRGYDVMGVEVDPMAVSFLKAQNIPVFHGTISELPVENTFHIITAFGVLEHIPDPVNFLKSILCHLKPGGEILLGVPNVSSLNRFASQLSTHNWDMFLEPGHLFHYSACTLEQVADLAGLSALDWTTATIAIRGKIPFLPFRYPRLERTIQWLTFKSKIANFIYRTMLRILDWFKIGDVLVMRFQRKGE